MRLLKSSRLKFFNIAIMISQLIHSSENWSLMCFNTIFVRVTVDHV